MSSIWDVLVGAATGGFSFLLDDSGSDAWDPFHLFTKTDSQKLSEYQWDWQTDWIERNYATQNQWKRKEFKAAMDELRYQHDLNTMQMRREDDAVRRRVADLEAAGLSPTLAAGSAASATPVHAGNVPQIEPPQHGIVDDPRVQAAMFKEGMMKDRIALALTAMGNMADVSRTKAETELIKAEKDRYVAETPIDLRLKEIEQEISDSTVKFQIKQKAQETEINELKKINTGLTNMLLQKENGIKAYEVVMKSEEAKAAPQYYLSRKEKLQQEVVDKTIANEMADFLNKTSKDLGVPHEMMSSKFKDVNSWMLYGKKSAQDRAKYNSDVDKESNVLKRWFGNFKNWRSPSLLYR